MKGVLHRDGKKSIEWDVLEVQFFDRLDPKLFAKP